VFNFFIFYLFFYFFIFLVKLLVQMLCTLSNPELRQRGVSVLGEQQNQGVIAPLQNGGLAMS